MYKNINHKSTEIVVQIKSINSVLQWFQLISMWYWSTEIPLITIDLSRSVKKNLINALHVKGRHESASMDDLKGLVYEGNFFHGVQK